MNERDNEAPFPREPWRRLLGDSTDGPPETTDARIRAAARRDLAPRGRRWWLPASLAASFVLAVMIVQSQFGTIRRAPTIESDRGAGGEMEARIVEREAAEAPRPAGPAPEAAGTRRARAPAAAEPDDYGYPDSEIGADSAGIGPRIGGPEHDVQEASEMPEAPAAIAAAPASIEPGPAPVESQLTAIRSPPPAFEKTPETWYAHIEKLREQGEVEEADRQLARLREAHPGWVERHLAKQPPR